VPTEAAPLAATWERTFSTGGEARDFFQVLCVRRLVDESLLVVVREGFGASAVRYGAGGMVLSESSFHPSGLVVSAAIDPFGFVVLVLELSLPGPTYDLGVIKYDTLTGRQAWLATARIHGVPFQHPSFAAIAPSGDVFVTAAVYGAVVGSVSWTTLCYDGRTGNVLWGPALYGDSEVYPQFAGPVDLAIDQAGDLVVTGFAAPSDGSLWAAIKYRGATGERLWGPIRLGAVSSVPPPMVCPSACYSPPTAAKCAFDRKGNVFLTASSFTGPYEEAWLTAKYDGLKGNLIWGPVSHKSGSDFDVPSAIGVNGNGDVVVGGSAISSPNSVGGELARDLIKYSGATGARIWGPAPVPSTISVLAFDGGGDVIVTGSTLISNHPTRTTASTSKFDGRSGARLWTEEVGEDSSSFSSPSYVVIGSDGNITSVASAYIGSGTSQHPELHVVNSASGTGATVWGPVSTRSHGAGTYPLALLADANGDTVLVAASGEQPGSIVKYARDGHDLWGPVKFPRDEPDSGWPTAAVLDPHGDIIVAGSSLLSKFSGANGAPLWGPVRIENLDYPLTAVTTDPAGDVLVIGQTSSGWETLKYRAATGDLLWISPYQPSPTGGAPADIAVDHNGDVFVAGSWYRDTTGPVWVTFKYKGATGDVLWGPILSGGTGAPKKLAVDDNGDAIVTGIETSARGNFRKTIKCSGQTGSLLWNSEVATGLISNSALSALALDQAGDIFVAGGRVADPPAQFPNQYWSTEKIRGRTGELVWGPRDFPAPTRADTVSMTIDSRGNPAVAGTVWNGANDEWMLVGYDSSTGDILFGPDVYDTGSDERVTQVKSAGSDLFLSGTSEGLARTVGYSQTLGIMTSQKDLAPAPVLCGALFHVSLTASNALPPFLWDISAGGLPPGIALDPLSGDLSGVPSRPGSFSFVVRVREVTGAAAERGFVLDVLDGGPYAAINAVPEESCVGGGYVLTVPGSYVSYRWSPGGETTPAISVCPAQPTLYSVVLSEEECERRGSIELQPFKIELVPREPLAPPGRKRPKIPSIPAR
jgi:hypothetical protein